jgi:hypothetical protein
MMRAAKTAARPTSRVARPASACAPLRLAPLQRKPAAPGNGGRVPDVVHEVLAAPGRLLDAPTRTFMERRFAHDFGRVRVHTDARAAQSADTLHARAYTVGSDVVFAANQYSPATPAGRRLLAHELTHVVQQGGAPAIDGVATQPPRTSAVQRAPAPDEGATDEDPAFETELIDLEDEGGAAEAAGPAPATPAAEATPAPEEAETPPINAAAASPLSAEGVVPAQHATEREADRIADHVIGARASLLVPPITARPAYFGRIHLDSKPKAVKRIDIAFVMGTDKPKSKNKFYTAAKKWFKANLPGVELIDDPKVRDLAAVFAFLRSRGDAIGTLYLISHAADDGTLSFPLKPGDKDKKVDYLELKRARKTSPDLFDLPKGLIDKSSTIKIKGCRLGQSARMLGEIGGAFGAGKVVAPKHRQYYEYETKVTGKGKSRTETTETYQGFKTYFVERPGTANLDRDDQVAAFAAKYTQLTKADWETLIPKKTGIKPTVDTRAAFKLTNTEPATDAQALAAARPAFAKEKAKPKKTIGHTDKPKNFVVTEEDGTVRSWPGKSVEWKFELTDGGTGTLPFDQPTDDKAILESIKADESVPEAYEWSLDKKRAGSKVTYTVKGVRTVWTLDQYIVDKITKKETRKHLYVPSESTKEFFGEYKAPEPPPAKPAGKERKKKK